MMEGIIDRLKEIDKMVYRDGFMPDTDEEGNFIQSEEAAGKYTKDSKKDIEEGRILRYFMLDSKTGNQQFDAQINLARQKEFHRLNEAYYGQEKYLRIKQCMDN